MLKLSEAYFLGAITRLKGFKGEVHMKIDSDDPFYYEDLEEIYIKVGNRLVAYEVLKISINSKAMASLKLEGVDTEEEAKNLINVEVYLPSSELPELPNDQYFIHDLLKCNINDVERGDLGAVVEVIEQGVQRLLVVKKGFSEIYIPLIDQYVENVDMSKFEITVNLPDDIYNLND